MADGGCLRPGQESGGAVGCSEYVPPCCQRAAQGIRTAVDPGEALALRGSAARP